MSIRSAAGAVVFGFGTGRQISSAALSTGDWLCLGLVDSIEVWDPVKGVRAGSLPTGSGPVIGLAAHPRRNLVASCDQSRTVSVWDVATLKRTAALPASDNGLCTAFSPDGPYLGCGQFDGAADMWHHAV